MPKLNVLLDKVFRDTQPCFVVTHGVIGPGNQKVDPGCNRPVTGGQQVVAGSLPVFDRTMTIVSEVRV